MSRSFVREFFSLYDSDGELNRMKVGLLASVVFVITMVSTLCVVTVREQTKWQAALTEVDRIHIAVIRDMLAEQPQGAILEWENSEFTVVHLARDSNHSAGMKQDGREYTFPLGSDRTLHSIVRIYKITDPGYLEASKKFFRLP